MSAVQAEAVAVTESEGKATFPVPKSGRRPAKMPEKVQEVVAEPEKEAETAPEPEKQTEAPHHDGKGPKWVAKDQWQGDPDDWVSEKEFKKRQELYDSISTSNKKMRETDVVVAELREHNRKMADALRKATLGDKLKDREAAIVAGDRDQVYAIEREMQEVHAAIPQIEPAKAQPPPTHPDYESWANRNDWFKHDAKLHHAAIGIHQEQLDSGDRRPFSELLDDVTKEIRRRYPEKFGGKPANDEERPPPRRGSVEMPSTARLGGKKQFRFSDLNYTQQTICKKFVRKGVMSEADYIADLVSIGELK